MSGEQSNVPFDVLCRFLDEVEKLYTLLREVEKALSDTEHDLELHEKHQEHSLNEIRDRIESIHKTLEGDEDNVGLAKQVEELTKAKKEHKEAETKRKNMLSNFVKKYLKIVGFISASLGAIWTALKVFEALT